ncbi:hypothetical protein NPIL_443621 [Nephila pilipes]|uniref:Uncharacterized protein n=1 Tax=Nephila pilipes TaxID=299642 RepID=A0A8X6UBN9_NEPPI|nr:hypothetical protein NPIL_443621 [Nephila pilipes]
MNTKTMYAYSIITQDITLYRGYNWNRLSEKRKENNGYAIVPFRLKLVDKQAEAERVFFACVAGSSWSWTRGSRSTSDPPWRINKINTWEKWVVP